MSTDSAAGFHPLAPSHLPSFISDAAGADPMMTNVGIFVVVVVFLAVTFFLHLHSLPEKLAHQVGANQLQIVGVLALIALFTHNNLYWVAALMIALIQIPDYETPLGRIAAALEALKQPSPDRASPTSTKESALLTTETSEQEAPAPTKEAEA
ncbi:hypothetical protein [uncultured Shimia sp.]|uniref:hypothetical protein n=1 Tax=uncultured Shimia sp. TaxID=573152 RepID=UPI002627254D|nr:hypothetical protein [uncultured Shimia sp.]